MAELNTPETTATPPPTMPLEATGEGETPQKPVEKKPKVSNDEIVRHFKTRLAASDRNVENFKSEWKSNVDIRLGRPNTVYTAGIDLGTEDENQTSINPDWSLTKTKTANLFSQVPGVQVANENDQFKPAIGPFTKALNYELGDKRAKTGAAMAEAMNDIVNASGVAGIVIGYAARFETKIVPVQQEMVAQFEALSPEQQQVVIDHELIPMREVQVTTSSKFYTNRISPLDLRTPAEFVGSDFNQGPWMGYRGRMSWADATHELRVREADKSNALGGAAKSTDDISLRTQPENEGLMELETVSYTVIYYWRSRVDPDEKSFDAIWKLVLVDGLAEPTVHEAWKGQKWNPKTKRFAGCTKFPVQVGTITYISDNPIPPSDSAAGRPQVNDLRRSRSQMFMNRDRSVPIRGFNSSLVEPDIRDLLMRGDYQGMIPFMGNMKDAMWEVARASYPAEDLSFDRQTKADLMESWQVAPGSSDPASGQAKTKAEVTSSSAAFSVVVGQERAKVAAFFLNVVEVLAGLMSLYSDFPNLTDQERQQMQQAWPMQEVSPDLTLSIRPDSTITLAPEQRIDRLFKWINMMVKSGLVNPGPVVEEITELSGIDPAKVMKQPDPPKTPEAKISLRLNGKGDMQNSFTVATMFNGGKPPSKEQIDAVKVLLLHSQNPNPAPPQPGQPGQDQQPPKPGPLNQAHPQWSLANKIAKRSRDLSSGGNPGGAS